MLANLNIMLTESGLSVRWRVTAWEVLGFEGSAVSPAQQRLWSESIHWFEHPETLWRFNADAKCLLQGSVLQLPIDTFGPSIETVEGQNKESPFFDFEVFYQCANRHSLSSFHFSAFVLFPTLSEVYYSISGVKSAASLLTPSEPLVNLCVIPGALSNPDSNSIIFNCSASNE